MYYLFFIFYALNKPAAEKPWQFTRLKISKVAAHPAKNITPKIGLSKCSSTNRSTKCAKKLTCFFVQDGNKSNTTCRNDMYKLSLPWYPVFLRLSRLSPISASAQARRPGKAPRQRAQATRPDYQLEPQDGLQEGLNSNMLNFGPGKAPRQYAQA